MAKNGSHSPAPVWEGADYARVPEGTYQAIGVRHQGPDWVRRYSRWSLIVEFELLDDGTRVCAFYNFGNGPEAKVLRNGNFFKAWTLANGEMPRKGQRMFPDVFLEGQVFIVEVKDSRRNSAEEQKADAEIYSVVTKIISVQPGPTCNNPAPNQKSFNQESINQKSSNHPIKQSTNQVGQYAGRSEKRLASFV